MFSYTNFNSILFTINMSSIKKNLYSTYKLLYNNENDDNTKYYFINISK